MRKLPLLILLLVFTIKFSPSIAQDTEYFVGEWEVTVQDTPNGTVKVLLSMERVDGKLKGKFVDATTNRETTVTQINEQDQSVILYFFAEGYDLYLSLKPDGEDKVSGTLADSFLVSGQRVKK
jgi:hypothetical protein